MTPAKASSTVPTVPWGAETAQAAELALSLPGERRKHRGGPAFNDALSGSPGFLPQSASTFSVISLNFTLKLYNLKQSQ